MEAPYTIEELKNMSVKDVLALPKKCPRLRPYCLIGLHIDEVRSSMNEWSKHIGKKVEMLISGQGCLIDFKKLYYFCVVNEDGIMTDVCYAFDNE